MGLGSLEMAGSMGGAPGHPGQQGAPPEMGREMPKMGRGAQKMGLGTPEMGGGAPKPGWGTQKMRKGIPKLWGEITESSGSSWPAGGAVRRGGNGEKKPKNGAGPQGERRFKNEGTDPGNGMWDCKNRIGEPRNGEGTPKMRRGCQWRGCWSARPAGGAVRGGRNPEIGWDSKNGIRGT